MLMPARGLAVTEHATLEASFSPDGLGTPTTITFGFHLATSEGAAPPPLTSLDLKMPAGMNYTTTTLGLAICQPARAARAGSGGLPAKLAPGLRLCLCGSAVRHRRGPRDP